MKANNLPLDLSVHSLRHTNASLLISQGVDVRTVASLLGHAQASTTLDIYAHAFDKNKRKAQEKLGKGDWIMRKIKLTRANKSILLKALAPYYYREKALGHSTEKPGRLILKINSLPADKKATFSTEEIRLMRTTINQTEERTARQKGNTPMPQMICY